MSSITAYPQDLKVSVLISNVKQEIITKLSAIPNFQLLKNDISVILFVCNAIENYGLKPKYQINKCKLVTEILVAVFGLNEDETTVVIKHIQFLFNSKLIQRLKTSVILYRSLKSYIFKKLL